MSIAERPNHFPWPPVILVSAIGLSVFLDSFFPLAWLPSPLQELMSVLGIMIIGGALFIDVAAMLAMQRAKTTILPHKGSSALVTGGPFSFSRNPIYLANVLLLFGLGLALGNLWFWVLARFPAAFLAYRKKVRRWI
jgi:protein-S-isoprenylcysteine O-methyltransferase Ste14